MNAPHLNLARFDFVSVRLAVVCARVGNLTEAAGECHLVLPAASRRLRDLEVVAIEAREEERRGDRRRGRAREPGQLPAAAAVGDRAGGENPLKRKWRDTMKPRFDAKALCSWIATFCALAPAAAQQVTGTLGSVGLGVPGASSSAPSVPASSANRAACFICPSICGSPSTIESRPLATRNAWRTACGCSSRYT